MTMLVERLRAGELSDRRAIAVVAALVGAMFMASTLVTPLYVIYNALPVIGVGMLSTWANAMIASFVFALTIGAFAVAALIVARRYLPRRG